MAWSKAHPQKDGWFWAHFIDPEKGEKTQPAQVRNNCSEVYIPVMLESDGVVNYVKWYVEGGKLFPINSEIFIDWGEEILSDEHPHLDCGANIAPYQGILPFIHDKTVLDYGCGCGIGSNYIGSFCKKVLSYDISKVAIEEGRKNFPHLTYVDNYMLTKPDIIVMCEVFEHIEKPTTLTLLEDFTLLCPEIVITTPNGDFFKYQPKTPAERFGFHVWHYQYNELREIFLRYYKFVIVFGLSFDPKHSQFMSYGLYASNNI